MLTKCRRKKLSQCYICGKNTIQWNQEKKEDDLFNHDARFLVWIKVKVTKKLVGFVVLFFFPLMRPSP